jgi:hypothetical protein
VFENRVLRRIFGLKKDEVTGEWRKLHRPLKRPRRRWVIWPDLVRLRLETGGELL